MGGDFNITRYSHEHSARPRISPIMSEFNNFITSAGLIDFSPNNCQFTWSNFQASLTMVTLDRFLVSQGWEALFPRSICSGKARVISDHIPICLDTQPPVWGPFPFKFYKSWLCKDGFGDFVGNLLPSFATGFEAIPTLAAKLKMSKLAIKEWLSSRRFDHQARLIEIEHLIQELDLLGESSPLTQANLNRKRQLRSEHFNILHELEIY